MKRVFGALILAGALLTGLSCGGDGGTGSGPGVLKVKLTAPVAKADPLVRVPSAERAPPPRRPPERGFRLSPDPAPAVRPGAMP